MRKFKKFLIGSGVFIGVTFISLPFVVTYTTLVFHLILMPLSYIDGFNYDGVSGSLLNGPRIELIRFENKDKSSLIKVENILINYEIDTEEKNITVQEVQIDKLAILESTKKKNLKPRTSRERKRSSKNYDIKVELFNISEAYIEYYYQDQKRKLSLDVFKIENLILSSDIDFERFQVKSNLFDLDCNYQELSNDSAKFSFYGNVNREEKEEIIKNIKGFFLQIHR